MQDIEPTEGSPAPEASSGRTFWFIAIPLIVVTVLMVCVLGGLALWLPRRNADAQATQNAMVNATNTQIAFENNASLTPPTPDSAATATAVALQVALAQAATETAVAASQPTSTPASPTPVIAATKTNTPAPTNTPVATNTPGVSAAEVTPTVTPTGPTKTPTKGPSLTPTKLIDALKLTPSRTPSPTLAVSPTQLPGTGLADNASVPVLIVVGVALAAAVIAARQLRFGLRS